MKCLSIKVIGKVQGVWFRASTQRRALELGLNGFVKNNPDGTVYIEAEGEEGNLNQFINWCKTGPPLAKVKLIEQKEIPIKDFSGFNIER